MFNKDAKELCLDSWALAASALFHSALINIDAKYNVLKKKKEKLKLEVLGNIVTNLIPFCLKEIPTVINYNLNHVNNKFSLKKLNKKKNFIMF